MGKLPAVTALVLAALALVATPALAAIESFDATPLESGFDKFREINFEDLQLGGGLPSPGDPVITSIRIGSVSFTDPDGLQTGFCSSPTCSPDPQNPDGGNNELFLNPGGAVSFGSSPKLVVIDVQGIGDNPFQLLVTDGAGGTLVVNSQGVLFGRVLLGLRTGDGVRRIELTNVGGTGGPIALARVLFAQNGR